MATYQEKQTTPLEENENEVVESGSAVEETPKADDVAAATGEGKPKRERRQRKSKAATAAVAEGEQTKNEKTNRGKSQGKGEGKKMSKEEKARQDLDKKRSKMQHQYEPFQARRMFNSRFQEYQFAEWRKRRNNLFVTVDTIVPALPAQPREEPDDARYHLDVACLDEQIEEYQEEFKSLVAEQAQVRAEIRDEQNGRNPIKAKLRELFSELKTYTDEKKDKLASIETISKQIMDVNRELDKQRKNIHPIYNEADKLEKGIKELENRLQTHSWAKPEEQRLMKEIQRVQASRPFFEKIEELRGKVAELKQEREATKQGLTGPNKIIASLKARIDEQKGAENKFDSSKKLQQHDLINVSTRIEQCLEKTRMLKKQKYELKESFYGSMCDYEIEETLIKDIEWIEKTKEVTLERAERAQKYRQDQKARKEEQKRYQDERNQRQAEYLARQEERNQEQETKKREWELSQLSRFDTNPYEEHIDVCEQLIYFCARQKSRNNQKNDGDAGVEEEENKDGEQSSKKNTLADVQKGKVQVVASKAERDAGNDLNSMRQEKKKRQRKRDGPSIFSYDDEDRTDLDYATTQKFGMLEISPPTELEQIEACNKLLVSLREALKLKGTLEQADGRAKLTHDDGHQQAEKYLANKASYAEVDDDTKKSVDKIFNALKFRRNQHENEEEKEDTRGGRFAGRGDRQGGDRRGNQTQRGRRDVEHDDDNQERNERAKADRRPRESNNNKANKGPREQLGGNMESFPELN